MQAGRLACSCTKHSMPLMDRKPDELVRVVPWESFSITVSMLSTPVLRCWSLLRRCDLDKDGGQLWWLLEVSTFSKSADYDIGLHTDSFKVS